MGSTRKKELQMKSRILQVAVFAAALVPVIGCGGATASGLFTNIWRGFGLGLGFIPADVVGGIITDLIGDINP